MRDRFVSTNCLKPCRARRQVEIGQAIPPLSSMDEAGMLSTRQAHHILQLSERHGAKIVFAGDTQQQQPVEAGLGLRLVCDVALAACGWIASAARKRTLRIS